MNRIHMTISKLHKVVFSLIRQRDDYEVVSVADNFFFCSKVYISYGRLGLIMYMSGHTVNSDTCRPPYITVNFSYP